MTELNQSTLRGILAQVLSVNESCIVPKQGNWFNPQANTAKPDTWCAYKIKSNRPRTSPYYDANDGMNTVCVQKIAEIELQFVGPQSEQIAQSVCLWPLRDDVKNAFSTVQGAVLNDEFSAISSPFSQEGTNTLIAWNVTFRVAWISVMNTAQTRAVTIDLGGHLNV